MAQMKNFESAAREARPDNAADDRLTFRVNGTGLDKTEKGDPFAANRPTTDQVILLASSFGEDVKEASAAAGMFGFLRSVLEKRSWLALKDRLEDPEDPLVIDDMQDIIRWLMEEAADRPTKPRSDSSGSRASTGRASRRVSSETA